VYPPINVSRSARRSSSLRVDKRPRVFDISIGGDCDWRNVMGLDGTTIQPLEPAWYTWLADFHHPLPVYQAPQGRRGRWSRFQAVAIRARRFRRWKGGSRGRFVRLTIVIRSLLRVWHYCSVADHSRVVLCASVLARGHVTSKKRII